MSIGKEKFLMLSRDSGAGHGSDSSESLYRQIDVLNLAGATDIKGSTFDAKASSSITTADDSGVLKSGITPATYCPFVNMNDNTQLAKFGLHNGGAQNAALLNEKWEGLAMVPVDGLDGDDDWWYVIAVSDNDFITQNGTLVWLFSFFVSFLSFFLLFFLSLSLLCFATPRLTTTDTGTYNFGKNKYSDKTGYNLDNQALVFKIKLPDHSRPYDPTPVPAR